MRKGLVVTIDGPAGAGKTTVARMVAKQAGLTLLDTGATYRAVALKAKRTGVPWTDGEALGRMCETTRVSFAFRDDVNTTFLDGEDVSAEIRTPEMGSGASAVSTHPQVREHLVGWQRLLAQAGGVVAEGRDTGTVVFPRADAKFFLDANAAVRAMRRIAEIGGEGKLPFEEMLRDVLRRDLQDSTRAHSPLRLAGDMRYADTTVKTAEEVTSWILSVLAATPND